MRKQDFIRGAIVFPVAGLACWTILAIGRGSQDWGVGVWAVLVGAVLAVGGIIWTLVAGLVHSTFKISTFGLLAGLLLVGIVGGF
ncbi:hypothetical protein LMG18101_04472 [Ralstonia flaminis]|uniref:Uncharacterized protein n=2 Tax=Ralstonia flaminis TaxID=3058597 RepID=A0ABM9KAH1_9RALS|nr:hypothetical protein LMG18101_04472 [Ralstonia sp. LMG 18101]